MILDTDCTHLQLRAQCLHDAGIVQGENSRLQILATEEEEKEEPAAGVQEYDCLVAKTLLPDMLHMQHGGVLLQHRL